MQAGLASKTKGNDEPPHYVLRETVALLTTVPSAVTTGRPVMSWVTSISRAAETLQGSSPSLKLGDSTPQPHLRPASVEKRAVELTGVKRSIGCNSQQLPLCHELLHCVLPLLVTRV